VQLQITPGTILLGEPVWVDVAVTNRSSEALRVEMGSPCLDTKELTVHVPGAEAYNRDRKRCSIGRPAPAASCVFQGPVRIDAGATFSRRYVLRGDFRIARAGSYKVFLEKDFPYGADLGGTFGDVGQNFPHLTQILRVRAQRTLTVLPENHNALLQIEKTLAEEIAAPLPNVPPPNASIEVVRQISDERSKLQDDAMAAKTALATGLIEYPTAGMEPIFSSWLDQNNTTAANWAEVALSHLNTPDSRKILARQAASRDKPQDINFQIHRWEAIESLSNMGDKSYLPLLEKLTRDPYHDVQRSAVRALGVLGGEKELRFLNAIAVNAKTLFDRQDAIMAMGDTGSLQAVPLLINLFTLPDSDQPGASGFALFTLTHARIRLSYATRMMTLQEAKLTWQEWWLKNQRTARAFGPYDCADLKDAFNPAGLERLGRGSTGAPNGARSP